MDIVDDVSVKRLIRERCITLLPLEDGKDAKNEKENPPPSSPILNANQKAIEEKPEEERRLEKPIVGKHAKNTNRGERNSNGKNNKL